MRSILPIFRRSISESWRSLLGWTIGVLAVLGLYLPLFPSIGGNGQMEQILESMPPELVTTLGFEQIATGAGYAQSTFFGLIGFVLLVIAATSWGSQAIAGAEESGRLELALAHGVGRVQYALESALSILVRLLWLGGIAALVVLGLNGPSELEIEPVNILAAAAALVGLAMVTGTAALAAGAISGRSAVASAVGAGIAVLGYALNAIGNQQPDAEAVQAISPYAWAYRNTPLTDGADWPGLALLWGLAAVFVVVSAIALRRRDVTG